MNKNNVKYVLSLALVGAVFFLSACSFERAPEVLQSPLYKAGFAAGCQTGQTRVSGFKDTIHRDASLYKNEEVYRAGWGDGYSSCGGQQQFDDNSVFNERQNNSTTRY